MKKIIKIFTISAGIFFSIILLLVLNFVYVIEFKTTDVGTEQSSDGKYEVLFQMRGEPDWPFGKTDLRVIVKNSDGKVIDKKDTIIWNDGGNLHEDCWEVEWYKDSVKITLTGEEQEDETYQVLLK